MRKIFMLSLAMALGACNFMSIHPGTLDTTKPMFIDRGGDMISLEIKDMVEKRGYPMTVGYKRDRADHNFVRPTGKDPTPHYIFQIKEASPTFWPTWCIFNGLWWWNFNISVADNRTGEELLLWVGRGCRNSTLRKLDDVLDQLEMKK